SVAALRALLDSRVEAPSLAPLVDPRAAEACHRAGVGARVELELGHQLDPRWGQPLKIAGEVTRLSDGRFKYSGGIWEGRHGEMGPSAVLRVGPIQILIATHATYDWADEQFRSVALDARQAKFVVVKNPMNYRLGYEGISRAAYILDTPGPTPAVVDRLAYRKLQRPYFPADREIAGFEPGVYLGRRG
ncbi:MAG TPA: MlrC C-terminal domain-containing protein, partial [Pirellulales bacterium]|nr:MlrC C-terminal domain-containing protein [Pirellulales bacterium]